jgi:signal transduction histidine kinase
MQAENLKYKFYLYAKWAIIMVMLFYIAVATLFHLLPLNMIYIISLALALMFTTSLLFTHAHLHKKNYSAIIAHLSLFIDLFIILFALYFSGGLGSTWLFFPIVIIYLAGYLFDLRASLVYASFSFTAVVLMFLMEHYNLTPAFFMLVRSSPKLINKSVENYFGNLFGTFILYFSGAFISGYLNQIMSQVSQRLEESLNQAKLAQHQAETTQKAMANVAEDLEKAKESLEIRVRERTAELEEAKANLEEKIAERTNDLEKARKAVLHMLKDLKEDMVKLQTIDSLKSEFLSMVSHELRTPITPIKGYLTILLAGGVGALSPSQHKFLTVISRQTEHLLDLIESLLDISRLELGKPIPTVKEPLSMKKVIENITEGLDIIAKSRQITLDTQVAEELPTIIGDETKLKRVVTNLIGNSLKFTSKGGKITVRGFVEGDNIRVEVIDNGIGIAREYTEKIFTKFFQVDSSYSRSAGGIGMGLAITRELVELHGGKVWAESEGVGKGAKFIFVLPTAKEEEK